MQIAQRGSLWKTISVWRLREEVERDHRYQVYSETPQPAPKLPLIHFKSTLCSKRVPWIQIGLTKCYFELCLSCKSKCLLEEFSSTNHLTFSLLHLYLSLIPFSLLALQLSEETFVLVTILISQPIPQIFIFYKQICQFWFLSNDFLRSFYYLFLYLDLTLSLWNSAT